MGIVVDSAPSAPNKKRAPTHEKIEKNQQKAAKSCKKLQNPAKSCKKSHVSARFAHFLAH
jgi:hypothetical protein